jgi:hypothetical protein
LFFSSVIKNDHFIHSSSPAINFIDRSDSIEAKKEKKKKKKRERERERERERKVYLMRQVS